jgi:hypothetical protein
MPKPMPMPILFLVALSMVGCAAHTPTSSEATPAEAPAPLAETPAPLAETPAPLAEGPAPLAEGPAPGEANVSPKSAGLVEAHAASIHWRCAEDDGAYRELIVNLKSGPMDPTLKDTIRVRGFKLTANTPIDLAGAHGPFLADLGVTLRDVPVDVAAGTLTPTTTSGPLLRGSLKVQLTDGASFDLAFESPLPGEMELCG